MVVTCKCDAKKLDRHRSDTGNSPIAPSDRARPATLPPLQPWLGAIVPAVAVLTIQSPQTHPHRAIWCNFGAVAAVPSVGDVEPIAPCRSDSATQLVNSTRITAAATSLGCVNILITITILEGKR